MTPKRALQIFVGLLVIGVVAFVYRWKTLPVLEEELPPEDVPMGAPTNTEEWHPVIPEEGETTASKEAEELQQKMEEVLRAELENTEEMVNTENTETATSESTSTTKNSTVKVPTQKIPEATKQQRNNEAEKKGEIKKYKTKEEAAKAPEAEKKQQEQKQAEIRNENKGYDPWANVDPSIYNKSGDGKVNDTLAIPIEERMNSEEF